MLEKEEALKSCDFHALILLLCPDFPLEIVEKSLRMICSSCENLSAYFKDFIYAFQFQFYYKEFAKQSKQIYENSSQYKSKDSTSSIGSNANISNTKKKFLDSLETLSHQVNYNFPPKSILKEVMKSKENLDYSEFTLELARNEKLTLEIGKLPMKSQLAEYRSKRLVKLDFPMPEEKQSQQPQTLLTTESIASSNLVTNLKSAKPKKRRSHVKFPSDDSRSSSTESSSDSDV